MVSSHAVPAAELVALAREREVLVLEDLGSGALLDTTRFALMPEPTLSQEPWTPVSISSWPAVTSCSAGRRQGLSSVQRALVERVRHSSAGASCARRQDDAGRCGGDPTSLRARGSRIAHSHLADDTAPADAIQARATALAAALAQDGY